MGKPIPISVVIAVFARSRRACEAVKLNDNGVMTRCGSRDRVEIHHIKSKGRGGSNDLRNLVVLCRKHHTDVHHHRGDWTRAYRTHSWQKEGENEVKK